MFRAALALLTAFACQMPAHADGPNVSGTLKKMLGSLPIGGVREKMQDMVGALRQTSCGGGLDGCYATEAGELKLYFFTSKNGVQQTVLLVVDKKMSTPHVFGEKMQKVMGQSSLESPMIAISTTEFTLDTAKMPPSLKKVIQDSYFNVSAMTFPAGAQIAARASLGGPIQKTIEALGVKADQLTMRAAVVLPIPTDLASGAGTAAGMAQAAKEGETMKKAGADAAKPEAYVQFEFAPGSRLPMILPPITLTDASFFINNELTFGYKGNASFQGVGDKKILLHFQTPLSPEGAMDLLDFQFLMATPPSLTLEDAAHIMVAFASPSARLARYGGGFIRDIGSFQNELLKATQPLSMFKLVNPKPAPEYRFADAAKPFPDDVNVFNFVILGPLADGGPRLKAAGNMKILGQTMGSMDMSAGLGGFKSTLVDKLTVKLGPLGKQTFKVSQTTRIDKGIYTNKLAGDFAGQSIEVTMGYTDVAIKVNASCINPFEINASAKVKVDLNIADVFEVQPGVNVDPSKITGCIGKELEAAYNKVAGEFKKLGGYTASAANAELKKISDAAAAAAAAAKQAQEEAEKAAKQAQEEAEKAAKAAQKAAEDAQKAADSARKAYEQTKNAARDVANNSTNAAANAFKDAGNAFKKLGKKKKHKKGPDPKFAASVFDWDYYYDHNPDLVQQGADLSAHWKDHGFYEGRQGSPEFSVVFYLNTYPDLKAMCGTNLACGLQHWLDHGSDEGRKSSSTFSVKSYLNRYSDLQNAFGRTNYGDALDHWLTTGEDEGRDSRP